MKEEQFFLVGIYLKFPNGDSGIEGVQCETIEQAKGVVATYKGVAAEPCTCGKCPKIERIETIKVNIDITKEYGKETKNTPPSAWRNLIR